MAEPSKIVNGLGGNVERPLLADCGEEAGYMIIVHGHRLDVANVRIGQGRVGHRRGAATVVPRNLRFT